MVPIAGVLFALGYVMQTGLINPFIDRPEHSQFMLLVAIAIIMVNVLLLIFGPDARSVQTSYSFDSFAFGRIIVDATKVYAGGRGDHGCGCAVCLLPLQRHRQGDPRLRGQLHRRAGGRAQREAALCAHLRARRRLRRRGRLDAGADHRRDAAARAALHAACVRHRHHRRARLDARRAARRRADRHDRGAGRLAVHAVGQEHVRLRDSGAGAAVPARRGSSESARHERLRRAFRSAASRSSRCSSPR